MFAQQYDCGNAIAVRGKRKGRVSFMFVCSLKGKSVKLVGIGALLCAAVVLCLCLLPDYNTSGTAYVSAVTNETISFSGIKTPQDRLDFIQKFGIEVLPEPIEEFKTRVPKEFDSVYLEYNTVQTAQGLDLTAYHGKKVTRYTYKMTNYPPKSENEPYEAVYLNLIQYKDKVIGGDISSSEHGGFVRTFCDFSPAQSAAAR